MTPHIQNTSRKPMATGSAWGRLLTIAFLCLFLCMGVLANTANAVLVTVRNNGNGYGTIDFGPSDIPPQPSIVITPGFNQSVNMPSTVYLFNPIPDPGSVFTSLTKVPSSNITQTGANIWLVNPAVSTDIIYVDFSLEIYQIDASAGAGGTITPNGTISPVTVLSPDQEFDVAANANYQILYVRVNSVDQPAAVGQTSYSYTFATGSVTSNQTIEAAFEPIAYQIDASAGAGGTITPNGTISPVTVLSPDQVFDVAANANYQILYVRVNSVDQPAAVGQTSYSYTFATGSVTSNQTIEAAFEPIAYQIDASAGAGGTITPNGTISPVTVLSPDQEFDVAANANYQILYVRVNSVDQPAAVGQTSYSYTFATGSVTSNQTIEAAFEPIAYQIDASAGAGGTITPNGTISPVTVLSPDQVFDVAANANYQILYVRVNSVDQPAAVGQTSYSYTFATGSVTSNQTIEAAFEPIAYQIDASAGAGGTITPNGTISPVTVLSPDQVFDVAANANYQILYVRVNSVDQPAAVGQTSYSYTFATGSVTSNQTIEAAFEPIAYQIDASAGAGGTITPNGTISPVTVLSPDQVFDVAANANYQILYVRVNSVDQPAAVGQTSYSYTFATGSVTSNQTIEAAFEPIAYQIDASAGAGGTITPNGTISPVTVLSPDQVFDVAANANYQILYVRVNSVDQPAAVGQTSYNYTFATGSVTSTQTIEAAFEPIAYQIDASAGAGGTITPNGTISPVTVLSPDQVFTVTADLGYQIDAVLVNGAAAVPAVPAGATSYVYTFATGSVTSDQTIAASFVQIEYTLTVTKVGGFGTGLLSIIPNQATYHIGDVVTISASPGVGEQFINWTGDGVDIGGSPPDRQVTFDGSGSKTVTANFDFIEYTLTVTSAGGTGGATDRVMVSPPGTYHYGDVVALTANPQVGETFANWSGDLAGSTNPETITINGDKTVTANFEKIPVTLTMQVDILDGGAFGTVTPDPAGNPHSYLWGDTVAVSATPNPNTALANWSSNVVGGVVTMNGDQTVTPNLN